MIRYYTVTGMKLDFAPFAYFAVKKGLTARDAKKKRPFSTSCQYMRTSNNTKIFAPFAQSADSLHLRHKST